MKSESSTPSIYGRGTRLLSAKRQKTSFAGELVDLRLFESKISNEVQKSEKY